MKHVLSLERIVTALFFACSLLFAFLLLPHHSFAQSYYSQGTYYTQSSYHAEEHEYDPYAQGSYLGNDTGEDATWEDMEDFSNGESTDEDTDTTEDGQSGDIPYDGNSDTSNDLNTSEGTNGASETSGEGTSCWTCYATDLVKSVIDSAIEIGKAGTDAILTVGTAIVEAVLGTDDEPDPYAELPVTTDDDPASSSYYAQGSYLGNDTGEDATWEDMEDFSNGESTDEDTGSDLTPAQEQAAAWVKAHGLEGNSAAYAVAAAAFEQGATEKQLDTILETEGTSKFISGAYAVGLDSSSCTEESACTQLRELIAPGEDSEAAQDAFDDALLGEDTEEQNADSADTTDDADTTETDQAAQDAYINYLRTTGAQSKQIEAAVKEKIDSQSIEELQAIASGEETDPDISAEQASEEIMTRDYEQYSDGRNAAAKESYDQAASDLAALKEKCVQDGNVGCDVFPDEPVAVPGVEGAYVPTTQLPTTEEVTVPGRQFTDEENAALELAGIEIKRDKDGNITNTAEIAAILAVLENSEGDTPEEKFASYKETMADLQKAAKTFNTTVANIIDNIAEGKDYGVVENEILKAINEAREKAGDDPSTTDVDESAPLDAAGLSSEIKKQADALAEETKDHTEVVAGKAQDIDYYLMTDDEKAALLGVSTDEYAAQEKEIQDAAFSSYDEKYKADDAEEEQAESTCSGFFQCGVQQLVEWVGGKDAASEWIDDTFPTQTEEGAVISPFPNGNSLTDDIAGLGDTYGATRDGHIHAGKDVYGETGDPIVAIMDGGVVVRADDCTDSDAVCTDATGYGSVIDVEYPDGTVHRMAHLDTVEVEVGDTVNQGDTLGTMGRTGIESESVGTHTHYEVITEEAYEDGVASVDTMAELSSERVDPAVYFEEDNSTQTADGGSSNATADFLNYALDLLVPDPETQDTTAADDTREDEPKDIVDTVTDAVEAAVTCVMDIFSCISGGTSGGSNTGSTYSQGSYKTYSQSAYTPVPTTDLTITASEATLSSSNEYRFSGSIIRTYDSGDTGEIAVDDIEENFSTVIENKLYIDYLCDGSTDVTQTFTVPYRSFSADELSSSLLISEYSPVTVAGTHCFFFEADTQHALTEKNETNNTSSLKVFVGS